MVLLYKPMFSDSASGAFMDILVYRDTSPQASLAKMPRPSVSQTASQVAVRQKWAAGVAAWHLLSPSEKSAYEAAAPAGQNGYNAFMSEYMLA